MSASQISSAELRQHHLFASLGDEQLETMRKSLRVLKLADAGHLFEQGQVADRFYQVLSGQIKLYRLSPDGNERVIEVMQPGKTFAEAVMFMEQRRYPLNAQALGDTELLTFDSKVFLKILEDSPQVCFRLLADMSQRLHMRLNEIDYLTLQNASFRLVRYLLLQIPADQEDVMEVEISLNTSKSIIASRLSIQPETFSRILKNLSTRGLLTVKGKSITLHNVESLRDFES